jgi:hypothetical protein
MVGIVLKGGLGNQLFQYALGCAFEHRGKKVVYNNSLLQPGRGRLYLLDKLGLDLHINNEFWGPTPIVEEKSLRYNPDIFMFDECILNGFWQCERYFLDVQDEIRAVVNGMRGSSQTIAVGRQIVDAGEKSCFIHVRRTDNLRPEAIKVHGLISADDCHYYERAIYLMREKVPGVHFFSFSDDPLWLRENGCWDPDVVTVVDHNTMSGYTDHKHEIHDQEGGTEHEDLWLMSLCHHAIIANSSFSWWGAWLNPKQEDRIVIAPDPWFATKDLDSTDIIPDRWTRVKIR